MKVRKHGESESVCVPLAQAAVVLIGLRVCCSSAVLHEMAKAGVSVMLCDWRGIPDAALHSWTNVPSEVAVRQIAQSEMTLPRKKNAWAKIVKAKIRGQASCLDSLGIGGGEGPYAVSHPRLDPETLRITKDTRQENIGRGYLSVMANGSKGFQGMEPAETPNLTMRIQFSEGLRLKPFLVPD